jgi:hypothetical protein
VRSPFVMHHEQAAEKVGPVFQRCDQNHDAKKALDCRSQQHERHLRRCLAKQPKNDIRRQRGRKNRRRNLNAKAEHSRRHLRSPPGEQLLDMSRSRWNIVAVANRLQAASSAHPSQETAASRCSDRTSPHGRIDLCLRIENVHQRVAHLNAEHLAGKLTASKTMLVAIPIPAPIRNSVKTTSGQFAQLRARRSLADTDGYSSKSIAERESPSRDGDHDAAEERREQHEPESRTPMVSSR